MNTETTNSLSVDRRRIRRGQAFFVFVRSQFVYKR